MIIAFVGVDGSGKTTLSRGLKEKLVERGYFAAVVLPFEYLFLKYFLRLVRSERCSAFDREGKRNRFFLFKLWPILALADNWLYYLVKIRPLRKKYDFVIADRFFYDFAASFSYFGYTTSLLDKFYLHLLPKPDLTFVLDAPPETLFEREKNGRHSLDFFLKQREYYLNLANDSRLCKLNASLSVDELVAYSLRSLGVLE